MVDRYWTYLVNFYTLSSLSARHLVKIFFSVANLTISLYSIFSMLFLWYCFSSSNFLLRVYMVIAMALHYSVFFLSLTTKSCILFAFPKISPSKYFILIFRFSIFCLNRSIFSLSFPIFYLFISSFFYSVLILTIISRASIIRFSCLSFSS